MLPQVITEQAKALPDFLESHSNLPFERQRLLVGNQVISIVNKLQDSVIGLNTWQPRIDGKIKSIRLKVPDQESLKSEIDNFIMLIENISKDTTVCSISVGTHTIQ